MHSFAGFGDEADFGCELTDSIELCSAELLGEEGMVGHTVFAREEVNLCFNGEGGVFVPAVFA